MTRQARPDLIRRAVEEKGNESRMAEPCFYGRAQWTKHERITRLQCWRLRPIFSAQVKVSFAEDDRAETLDVHRVQRSSSGESHFNGLSSLLVYAAETGRECCGVVC